MSLVLIGIIIIAISFVVLVIGALWNLKAVNKSKSKRNVQEWQCSCGKINHGNFCVNCGQKKGK